MIAKDKNTTVSLLIWEKNLPPCLYDQSTDVVSDLESLEKISLNKYDEIFLLAEIAWGKKERTEFYGFELIKRLRVNYRILCPIIVCSFLPLSYFKDSRVLGTPGHYYLQLPTSLMTDRRYEGIDIQTLDDINLDIFHPLADIKKIMHDLPNDASILAKNISNKEENKRAIESIVRKEFTKIGSMVVASKTHNFNELTENLISNLHFEIDEKDINSDCVRSVFENYRQLIYGMLPAIISNEDYENKDYENAVRWRVLIIDDQQETCDDLSNKFCERGIQCHTATNGLNALEILKEDIENKNLISVIISDFRLYEDKDNRRWQPLQGYKILSTIFESQLYNSPYAYIMLTSRKGTILEQIKQESKFRINWFHKADVLSGGSSAFNLFYQIILDIGSEAFLRKHEMPDTTVWVNGNSRVDFGYSFFYKIHIESLDYTEAEKQINKEAIKSLDLVLQGKGIDRQIENQVSLKFDGKRSIKNQYIDKKFILLRKFRGTVLLARRIIWGLWDLGYDFDQIFQIMNPDYNVDGEEKLDQSKKTFFNTSLGISIKDVPISEVGLFKYSLLVEEQAFLKLIAKSFSESLKNGERIIIDKRNRDILFIFFEYMIENSELTTKIPLITNIFRKLEYGNVEDSELSKALKKIEQLLLNNPAFAACFRKATKAFYDYSDYEGLSEKYLNKLLSLKYW